MILIPGRRECVKERKFWDHALVCHECPCLSGLHGKGIRISTWLSEAQIDELEHSFEVFARAASAQALFEFTNKRIS